MASTCSAQAASGSLHPETATTIVDKLVAGLDDYVLPERAATLKGYLRAHLGEYQQVHSPEALADRLTTDLRAVGQDKHLTIRSHSNVPAKASDALLTAYVQALKTTKPEVMDFRLQKSRDDALENPAQALRNAGFGPS